MPSVRQLPLVNGEFYHVFNRGVARAPTFFSKSDYSQAILGLSYYRFVNPPMRLSRFKESTREQRSVLLKSLQGLEKHVEIICFVLMPNHFHFLLKQVNDNGISKFISQFTNSYTRYFNTVHERVGPIYQGTFKSVHVETDDQFIHLTRYIHLNPLMSHLVREENLFVYPWSSLRTYIKGDSSFIFTNPLLQYFSSPGAYKNFLLDYVDYKKRLASIQHLTLED